MNKIKQTGTDKFTWRYCIMLMLFVSPFPLYHCFWQINAIIYTALAFFLFIGGFALFLYFLYNLLICLLKKRWKKLLSLLASPFICFALFYILLLCRFSYVTDWIQFQLHKPMFLEAIAKMSTTDGIPRTKHFDVGGYGLSVAANGDYEVVYDESDKIAGVEKNSPCQRVHKLEGHFYFLITAEPCDHYQ